MAYTDWIELVDLNIPNKKKLSILEFGLGEGTKYLLDNFKSVYSYELSPDSKWYDAMVDKFSNYKNWKYELVLFRDVGFVDYNPNLAPYLLRSIAKLFANNQFDVVFMDGEYHVRGDIVDIILKRYAPQYVIIHDITTAFNKDGYDRIQLPATYQSVSSYTGEGTRIFYK